MNASTIPKEVDDVQGDGRWKSMHAHHIEECRLKKPDVLFVGDSLIHRLEDTDVWEKEIKPLNAVNAGIGADCTQHVLWRLENGLLQNCTPKIIIVLVGTNNHSHTPEEIADGIEAILWSIANFTPDAKTLLIGLLPRGEKHNPLREKIYQINYAVQNIVPTVPGVMFVNADPGFVRADNTISSEDMSDYLHMTRKGYRKFYDMFKPIIKKILCDIEQKKRTF